MKAKSLELLIANEARHRGHAEMVQRFQNLRNWDLLPKSRGMHADNLTISQIVIGILSIVPMKTGYVNYVHSLLKLKPVGGIQFCQTGTFGKAVEVILEQEEALKMFREMKVSCSGMDDNAHHSGGTAEIIYYNEKKQKEEKIWFVAETAVSLLQPGAEKDYNSRTGLLQIKDESVFYSSLFKKIVSLLGKEKEYQKAMAISYDGN